MYTPHPSPLLNSFTASLVPRFFVCEHVQHMYTDLQSVLSAEFSLLAPHPTFVQLVTRANIAISDVD